MFNPLVIALDVLQVGHLGETYEEWVHQPIVTKKGPRFFHSDFWEVYKSLSFFNSTYLNNWQCLIKKKKLAMSISLWSPFCNIFAMETVLDSYSLVGGSCHLVASFSLVHLHVGKQGPFTSRNRPIDSLGNIYLDVDRIHSSPVPFPHKDKELLVSYTHTTHTHSLLCHISCT